MSKSLSRGKKAPAPKKSKPKATKTKKVAKEIVEEVEKPKKATPKEKNVIEKKEAPRRPVATAERVKLGPHPVALVAARHEGSLHERAARGFSYEELASAGVPLDAARREGLSIDVRRRSVVRGNVDSLKGWFGAPQRSPHAGESKENVAVAPLGKKK